jgi:murein DD-endopeptidase MepM/ murein hydrolase activator NlpD
MQEFIVPEYTPVLAAANGIVIYVKDDSTIGGPNPIYQKYTNFITIMHANEEYSRLKALGTSKLKSQSRSSCQQRARDS